MSFNNATTQPGPGRFRRKAVALDSEQLATVKRLRPDKPFPIVIEPATDGINPAAWASANRQVIDGLLLSAGAVLLRGFRLDSLAKFDAFVQSFGLQLLDYFDQHTPRSRMSGNIYTSTEYPTDHCIPFHSENSKNHVWPMKIWFCCLEAPHSGGETPIADNRMVFDLLDPQIRSRFMERQVLYVRNFGDGLGLPWQTAFQTTDPAEVERRCRQAGMQWEWKTGNRLRVRHRCQAASKHPITGDMLWFNQAHLFHVSNVAPDARQLLFDSFKEEDLPSNSYYGDGSPIELSVLEEIREAFRKASVAFPWHMGDVMMLENMLIAHGRSAFVGPRKVVVAMAEACASAACPDQAKLTAEVF